MKIAIDVRSVEGKRAGKGGYTYNLVSELLKLDKKNKYVLYGQEGAFESGGNVEVRNISAGGVWWHLKVLLELRRSDIDVYFAPSSFIVPAFLSSKIKTVVTIHDLVAILFPKTHDKKAQFVEKYLIKRVLKRAARVLAVSKNTKNDLLKKFNAVEDKVGVLYCGVNSEFREIQGEALEKFRKSTDAPENFFMAVGTIIPRKNYVNLVRAFANVVADYDDYSLIVVGQRGWQYQEVFDEVERLKIAAWVSFLDYVSDESLIKLLNLADGFVFPSLYEGFGIPPLEAMLCGCPVVASNRSSVPEVVGDAALMVDPENVDDIAAGIRVLIEKPSMRERMRERGFKQAARFSWKRSAAELLKVFEGL